MFSHHKFIFVTFHPNDSAAACNMVKHFQELFPDRQFLGRHNLPSENSASEQILTTTLTLVLESPKTYKAKQVQDDLQVSLEKTPPNCILRICLVKDSPADNCPEVSNLQDLGVEVCTGDGPSVKSAIARADLLTRTEPKLTESAAAPASPGSDCNR